MFGPDQVSLGDQYVVGREQLPHRDFVMLDAAQTGERVDGDANANMWGVKFSV